MDLLDQMLVLSMKFLYLVCVVHGGGGGIWSLKELVTIVYL